MRVSLEEFSGGQPVVNKNGAIPSPVQENKPSFGEGVVQDFRNRVSNASDAQMASIEGRQSNLSGALQTVGQGAGFIGDLVTRGLGAVTPEPVKDVLKSGASAVAGTEAVQDVASKYEQWKQQNPEAAANLEATLNLGSILPVGGGVAQGARMGTKAALVGTGKALEVGADAVGSVGNVMRNSGRAIYQEAITPNVKEAEQLLRFRANTPLLTRIAGDANAPQTRASVALERGIAGTEGMIGVQAKRQADKVWNDEIAPAVKNSKATMSKDELFAPAIERINATTDPTRRQALINAFEALQEDYKGFDESFDLNKAQALKRDLDEFTPAKKFKGEDVANEVRQLQADMADAIRQKTYDSLDDVNIRKKYLDWANLNELQKVGVKAISDAAFKGGSGSLIGGLWDAATVPVKTIAGQVLYRVGNKLEFTGPQNIKTFGQYLQSKGYSKPTEYDIKSLDDKVGVGMSMRDISRTPEQVAKAMDKTDRNRIVDLLDNPNDLDRWMQAQPMLKAMQIDKADKDVVMRFLKEVLEVSGF